MSDTSSDDFSDVEYTGQPLTGNPNEFDEFSPSNKESNQHSQLRITEVDDSETDSEEDDNHNHMSHRFNQNDEVTPISYVDDDDEDEDIDNLDDESILTMKNNQSSISQRMSVRQTMNRFEQSPEMDENTSETFVTQHKHPSLSVSASPMINNDSIITTDSSMHGGNIDPVMNALLYNPRLYDNMKVSNEIKRLFEYIERFEPEAIELETKLKPFIPDYIPSIGRVDDFIKPDRPDGKRENLGLEILDEPCLYQSDPSTFDLQLRHGTKSVINNKLIKIRSIQNAQHNPNKLRKWIENMTKIKSEKLLSETMSNPLNAFQNNNSVFPEIEQLMQPWNTAFDDYIHQIEQHNRDIELGVGHNSHINDDIDNMEDYEAGDMKTGDNRDNEDDQEIDQIKKYIIPNFDIDLSVEDYIRVVCVIFDIPIHSNSNQSKYENLTQSLHLLFATYAAFQAQMEQ
eukprot:493824_1